MEHAAGVAMPAVFDDGDVDVDDVAFFQRLVVGNAMTHLVVDGGANRFGVGVVTAGVVVQRGRNGLLNLGDVVVAELVELVGGHAGHHVGREKVQHFGGQFAGDAHALCPLGVFVSNRHPSIIPLGEWAWPKGGIVYKPWR